MTKLINIIVSLFFASSIVFGLQAKDDADVVIDRIYDIYYVDWDNLEYESCQPLETQVAHYWFNGDTGRQIDWVANKPYTNWNRVEIA